MTACILLIMIGEATVHVPARMLEAYGKQMMPSLLNKVFCESGAARVMKDRMADMQS